MFIVDATLLRGWAMQRVDYIVDNVLLDTWTLNMQMQDTKAENTVEIESLFVVCLRQRSN